VDVFQPLIRANLDEREHVRYIDITSHYSNICAHSMLYTANPTRLLGPEIDRSRLDRTPTSASFAEFYTCLLMICMEVYLSVTRRDQLSLIMKLVLLEGLFLRYLSAYNMEQFWVSVTKCSTSPLLSVEKVHSKAMLPTNDTTPASARTWRILINHIHKELQHLAIITETGWKSVRPVFNKRELVQVHVLVGMPDITTMNLIMTVSHGYMHAKEPQVDLHDIFYPGLTLSLATSCVFVSRTLLHRGYLILVRSRQCAWPQHSWLYGDCCSSLRSGRFVESLCATWAGWSTHCAPASSSACRKRRTNT
jgi:hypothetical protein